MCKGLSKSSSNKITNVDEQEVAPSKKNARAACPMDDSSFFLSPQGFQLAPTPNEMRRLLYSEQSATFFFKKKQLVLIMS